MHSIKTTKEKLVSDFITTFSKSIHEALSNSKYSSIALFLSGGSLKNVYSNQTFKDIFENNINNDTGKLINIYLVDERYTSDKLADALNDVLMKSTGVEKLVTKYYPIIDSDKLTSLSVPEVYVDSYGKVLRNVLEDGGVYKLGLMGIGDDFHTAGISPNANKEIFDKLFNSSKLVSYHEFGKLPFNKRITSTMKALRSFNEFIILLKGEEKKNVLSYLLNSETLPLNERPCGIYKQVNVPVTIVTDVSI